MHATLAQGAVTYTGADAVPPDMTGEHSGVHTIYGDAEAESSENIAARALGSVVETGQQLYTMRRKLIDQKRSFKESASERWRLILTYKPPVL